MKFLKDIFLAGIATTALWQSPAKAFCDVNPLVDAAANGNMAEVRSYMEEDRRMHRPNWHVDSCDYQGYTPLHAAAANGHADIVRYLLAHNAPVNAETYCLYETPLHLASSAGHLDCVQLLVAAGAKLNREDWHHKTPLSYACEYGHLDVVQFLVAKRAEENLEDHHGHTPLAEAVIHDHPDVVAFLLANGSPVGTLDYERHKLIELAKSDAVKDMLRHRGLN